MAWQQCKKCDGGKKKKGEEDQLGFGDLIGVHRYKKGGWRWWHQQLKNTTHFFFSQNVNK